MSFIEVLGEHTVYVNPLPQLRSRQGKFPCIVQLPSDELLCLFELGEAFESVDSETYVTRSSDMGKTWTLQGPLYDMKKLPVPYRVSETMKPTLLRDGTLIAVGYRYDRSNPELPIGNPNGGLLPGENTVCFSYDDGRTWSIPEVIKTGYPEFLETSGSCIETQSGDLLAIGCPMFLWDGSNPSGQTGVLLRSKDKGKTWDCRNRYFTLPGDYVSPWEARLCEMQPGRIVTIVWAYDNRQKKHLANHVTVSRDNGYKWSHPIDTGHMGQASNLMWLGDERLLTIHAHRAGDVGLYVRLIDFENDKWKMLSEEVIWGKAKAQDTSKNIIDQFANLRFGQPSLLRLSNGEILATFWCIEDGLGKIKTIRLRLN
ncbi:MAG: sialidase family protein [Sedimentisphaerales bacterium]